jgi:hypothetical protein
MDEKEALASLIDWLALLACLDVLGQEQREQLPDPDDDAASLGERWHEPQR